VRPKTTLTTAWCVLTAFLGLARTARCATPASQSDGPAATQPAKTLELDLGDKATIKLVQIPAGKFTMGSPVTPPLVAGISIRLFCL